MACIAVFDARCSTRQKSENYLIKIIDDRYWKQPRIKRIATKYNVVFGYIDTATGTILF